MTSDLLPGLFGAEAAAERALVTLLEVEAPAPQLSPPHVRRRLPAAEGSGARRHGSQAFFETRCPLQRNEKARSSCGAAATASFGLRESACSIFAGVVLMLPPTDGDEAFPFEA